MNEKVFKIPLLIVDDNPENLLVMNAILRNGNYVIFEASSGEKALELFDLHEFAVILLDIQMPVMDGYEVARRINSMKKGHATPIIFVTAGMNETNLVRHGYEVGAVDYLFKPVDASIIRSKVSVFAELYKARLEIKEQERLLREIDEGNRRSFLDNALDAVVGMDENGEVNYWNQQAEKIFGWRKSEVMGKEVKEIMIPSEFQDDFKRGLAKFLQKGDAPLLNKRIEINALRRNGEEFPVEVSVTPILSDGHYSFSAFIRDISQRKLEQYNLKKAIQARDDFITICSHELKTPLTALQLQFQLAEKQYQKGHEKVFEREQVIKRIDTTNAQLRRMSRLIENMLDVTRMSSSDITLDKQELNPVRLMVEVLKQYRDQFEQKKIAVTFDNDLKEDVLIFGDPHRLEQVISNIINNAINYGLGNPIRIRLSHTSTHLSICVLDQGMGIKRNDIDRIFKRYERAISASEVSGLGLGLYIGQKIVQAHAGELRVESDPGIGSTFTVELPILQKSTELSH